MEQEPIRHPLDTIEPGRKTAIMTMAIPKQIRHLIYSDMPPVWSIFKVSTAWSETIENLRLTKGEQAEYESIWEVELNKIVRRMELERLQVENDPTRKYIKGNKKVRR